MRNSHSSNRAPHVFNNVISIKCNFALLLLVSPVLLLADNTVRIFSSMTEKVWEALLLAILIDCNSASDILFVLVFLGGILSL